MDRTIWSKRIYKNSCPAWPCKVCNAGVLKLVANSLTFEETESSKREHDDEAWDPDWIDFAFTAWAQCSNESCTQKYALSGVGGVEQQYTYGEEHEWDWFEYFVPKYCYPMPQVVIIPKKCPDEVSAPLRASFSLFYNDLGSCAGKIRVALERLMDHVSIDTHRTTKSGKQQRLQLHERIEKYAAHEKVLANHLLAIKWLGNTAIHELTNISRDDLLDAYEIIEHTLTEIIDQRSARIAQLASRLEQRHAPK
jgi:hypothetical protein